MEMKKFCDNLARLTCVLKFIGIPFDIPRNYKKSENKVYLFTGEPGAGMSRDVILPNQSEDKVE